MESLTFSYKQSLKSQGRVNDTNRYSFYSLPTDGCHHQKGGECESNHGGFDDAKRIYLIMIVIIKKGENVNVCIQVFYDAKV